jgi:hypothetical protein
MRRHRVLTAALLATAVAAGLTGGQLIHTHAADASTTHKYTLRLGDKVTVPALGQVCSVEKEGGSVDLFCARRRKPHHQVTIFRNQILVWKVGNPDHPVWTGKP